MFLSIKNKLLLTILIAISILGALAIFSIFQFSKDELFSIEKNNFVSLSVERSHELRQTFLNSQLLVQEIAENKEIIAYFSSPTSFDEDVVLKNLNFYNIGDRYLAIYLVDKNGVALVSTDNSFVGQDYSFRDYFKEAISGKPYIDISVGVTSKKLGYYFSWPVKNEAGEVLGIAVLKMKPEVISKSFDFEGHDKNFHVMLVDMFGVIIFSDKEERVYKSLGSISKDVLEDIYQSKRFLDFEIKPLQYDLVQKRIAKTSEHEVFEFFDKVDNESEILSLVKVENYPFYLVTEVNAENIFVFTRKISFILSIFVAIAVLLAGLLIVLLLNRFLAPLSELRKAAEEFSKGNFDYKVKVKSKDEFFTLAQSFNNMGLAIKNSRAEIDQKVKQQTREISSKAIDLENQRLAIFNILEDVEEEKNKVSALAEDLAKFKLAVDNGYSHIVITDSEGVILYANKAVERITGFSMKDVLGKKAGVRENWGGIMSADFYQELWRALKIDKKTFAGELRNKRKNGEEYDAYATISPVLGDNGEVKYFVGIERDITKEKQIDRAKSEFVSLASHQLRTPLSTINWYAEMLLAGDAGKINKEQKDYLEEIYKGNQRMVDLVNALLNTSRIDLGTLAIDPKPTDLIELARSVLDEMKPQIIQRKQTVKTIFDKIQLINLDPKLMRIVFQNYLSNAVKYTGEKGQIILSVKKNKKEAVISVKDNGIGIPKSQQEKIFSKLFRADNVREKETDGTGLGLYIIKSVIEQFGGKVWFESVENKGTTFYATVPLAGVSKKEGSKGLEYTK